MILTIILFLVLLSVLVLAHEWGHFYSARKMGMKVEEFGLGFPPRIFSWRNKKGLLLSLNAIPIGGFVRIKGESGEERNESDSFATKSIPARLLVLLAGVGMNLVIAAVFLSVGFGLGIPAVVEGGVNGQAIVTDREILVTQVLPESPAAGAGIEVGDQILTINGVLYGSSAEIRTVLGEASPDEMLEVQVEHEGETVIIPVQPTYLEELQTTGLGVALLETGIVRYPWYMAPLKGIEATISLTLQIALAFGQIISGLFTGQEIPAEIAGPVGIAALTGEMAQQGFVYLLNFAALLSINLAILNAFPFPALDGGRIAFVLLEAIRRKPASPKLEAIVHNLGFAILMLLVIVITYKDILNFL